MADTVGNRLGPRAVFRYQSDAGTAYNISLDRSVALAVGNDFADSNVPRVTASGTIPVSPRYILLALQSDAAVTKTVIIGDPENPLFARDSGGVVTVNGVVFDITGRVGEKATFLKLEPAPET